MFTVICFVIVGLIAPGRPQDEEGPYRGLFLGKLNSYHHQIAGEVYAVDDRTLQLVGFSYDGTGDDVYFWAGDTGRPGRQGFIIPDQNGKTNVLERYYNEDVTLRLPEGKSVSRLRWLAVHDVSSQNTFGDVLIPEDTVPPAPRPAPALARPPRVNSGQLVILDANTILIPEFRFDGTGEVYFWVGAGPQPSVKGHKVPDEYGYLEPLRAYPGIDVTIHLPPEHSVFDISWLALVDFSEGKGSVLAASLLPERPNVPPSIMAQNEVVTPTGPITPLPHCKKLHRDVQVAWELFGSQLTIQLSGKIDPDEYIAFGVSGSATDARMAGADVAVARYDAGLQRALATDYNITDETPCVEVLGAYRGVCRDDRVGGLDSNQVISGGRQGGVTTVTYRRSLMAGEPMDKDWPSDKPVSIVWAVGKLDRDGEPMFHRLYPKRPIILNLNGAIDNDCGPFPPTVDPPVDKWEPAELFDPALRVFRFTVGPAGGRRGPGGALRWHVNGQLAPKLQLRRGLRYSFLVSGGHEPHAVGKYHPLVVTTGLGDTGRVVAGAGVTRRGRKQPAAAGPLCLATPTTDRRYDDDYVTFRQYNRTLKRSCEPGAPAELAVAPDTAWPDVVYYESFTAPNMGGVIYVVDRPDRAVARRSNGLVHGPSMVMLLVAVFFVCS